MNAEPLTLAERCYQHELASEELWTTVWQIMGGTKGEWDRPPYLDTSFDHYDNSCEVMLREDQAPMTREQADKILALGFSCVFESRGEEGRQWCKTYVGKCSPRTYSEDRQDRMILQAKLHAALAREQALRRLLEAVRSTEFDGFKFANIDGKNWWDVRDAALSTTPTA
jgi:hypothetical protein